MKILVAIKSSNNSRKLAKRTLPWAARAGYNMRIFVPDKDQLDAYQEAIADVNYDYYLDMPFSVVMHSVKPKDFAKANGFELLLVLPDDLKAWNNSHPKDKMIIDYTVDVAKARVAFGKQPQKKAYRFKNGAIMYRV